MKFASDELFGQWKRENVTTNLVFTRRPEDELAAMWAASEPTEFATIRVLNPKVRTVRG